MENLSFLLKEEIMKKTRKEYFNKDSHIWNVEVSTNWLNILLSNKSFLVTNIKAGIMQKSARIWAYLSISGQKSADTSPSGEISNPTSTEINENTLFDYCRKRTGTWDLRLV